MPFLISLTDGSALQLTEELATYGGYRLSPDGSRILVTGPHPRIYSRDGTLLRSIEVEEGYALTYAAWKPDGSGFAFIVGPKDFYLI